MTPPVTWHDYQRSIGDRSPLFGLLAAAWRIDSALYPGCYVDLSPSAAIPHVVYVDTDRRAARYFADLGSVARDLGRGQFAPDQGVVFHAMDYTSQLPVPAASQDLLISLYAGLVWDACRRYLRPGGLLLANTSHGDASIAALDPDLRLVAAVHQRDGRYRLDRDTLDRYLVPTTPAAADADLIRASGRGIAYTRKAFAYVFELSRPSATA